MGVCMLTHLPIPKLSLLPLKWSSNGGFTWIKMNVQYPFTFP